MFNNLCISLLPMHQKQNHLSLIYCLFYLRFVCPVEYILFMFTPHNTDLYVFFKYFFIKHNIDKQKNQCQPKKSKMKCLMNVWCCWMENLQIRTTIALLWCDAKIVIHCVQHRYIYINRNGCGFSFLIHCQYSWINENCQLNYANCTDRIKYK